MRSAFYFLTCFAFLLASCVNEEAAPDENLVQQVIYASSESGPESKTIIDDSTLDITWTAGDAINVFFGASESSRFVTSESGAVAQFKGSIDVVTGGGEGLDDDTSLWGIYPYDADNTCDGTHVTLTLPDVQEAAENTFANGLFPQIARSKNFYMSFYNLCGCFRFSVENPDIKSVKLSGTAGEIIAGKARISMDGVPVVEEIIDGRKELVMNAPDGGFFKPGVNYYFVLYPTTFSHGLSLTYYKESSYATYTYSNSYTLNRNKISRFANRDSGLTFVNIPLHDWEEGDNIGGEI